MTSRSSALAAALTGLALLPASALAAPSLQITAPATAEAGVRTSLTASGVSAPVDSDGFMELQWFHELNGPDCAPTVAGMYDRASAEIISIDIADSGPFSFTEDEVFPAVGSYRICGYLFEGRQAEPPDALATTVVSVERPKDPPKTPGTPQDPGTGDATVCTVPRLKGRTLGAAKTKLRRAHCALGTVKKPKKARSRRAKANLRVKRQSRAPGTELPEGTRINLVMVLKRR